MRLVDGHIPYETGGGGCFIWQVRDSRRQAFLEKACICSFFHILMPKGTQEDFAWDDFLLLFPYEYETSTLQILNP